MTVIVKKWSDNSFTYLFDHKVEGAEGIEEGINFNYINMPNGKFYEYSKDGYILEEEVVR